MSEERPGRGWQSAAGESAARWRIFLAEDDAEMRRLVAETLRKEGYDVFEAADGGQLLVRLARAYQSDHRPDQSVDLIVTDLRMPVCNGLDIVSALREAHWRTPIIVMTAFGDSATRERAEKLGAVMLDKPFRIDQ
jgi:two-component system chemotaxis response regulator CheY